MRALLAYISGRVTGALLVVGLLLLLVSNDDAKLLVAGFGLLAGAALVYWAGTRS